MLEYVVCNTIFLVVVNNVLKLHNLLLYMDGKTRYNIYFIYSHALYQSTLFP